MVEMVFDEGKVTKEVLETAAEKFPLPHPVSAWPVATSRQIHGQWQAEKAMEAADKKVVEVVVGKALEAADEKVLVQSPFPASSRPVATSRRSHAV